MWTGACQGRLRHDWLSAHQLTALGRHFLFRLIELLNKDILISETEVRELCYLARDILVEESNVQKLSTPITVPNPLQTILFGVLELIIVGLWRYPWPVQ